jgi:uncharacterized protein
MTTRCGRHSRPPRRRRVSRICICRTSRSAAPRRRSRAKPGSNRWPTLLATDPNRDPQAEAAAYVDAEKGVADIKAALDGARAILMERWSEDPALVGSLRDWLWDNALIRARVIDGKQTEGAKYRDYFDHAEPIKSIPSHRLLALMRARNEGFLDLELMPRAGTQTITRANNEDGALDEMAKAGHALAEGLIARHVGASASGRGADAWLLESVRLTWRVKLSLSLTLDLFGRTREAAEDEAIRVFGDNLKDLMLQAPAGPKVVLGLDPGLRTGVKIAAVDATGKVLTTGAVFPHQPMNRWDESIAQLAAGCRQLGVQLVSIGNGTASRETERLVGELAKKHPDLKIAQSGGQRSRRLGVFGLGTRGQGVPGHGCVLPRRGVDRAAPAGPAGRAGEDRPEGDRRRPVPARRQPAPPREVARDATVEDCVNHVGVDLNTASQPLLARVAGLSAAIAENIVKFRDANGPFLIAQANC